jgi:nickel/cobalt transporter (NicO) family protein
MCTDARSHNGAPSALARRLAGIVLLVVLATASLACRADTVASLLGNFTINQYCGLRLANDAVNVHYAIVFGQLPALRELHLADADGDGVTSQAERDAYAQHLAPSFADQLKLTVDGVAILLRATRWTTSLPTEQGGFSLRLDVEFAGALPSTADASKHVLEFVNQNYAGRFGWQEIAVATAPSLGVFDTNAFSTSLTGGLTEAMKAMPARGPLAERAIHLTFVRGAVPTGAQALMPRPGTMPSANPLIVQPGDAAAAPWLVRETRRLIDLISTPNVPFHIALLALLAAVVLGALHAFSPGHGKTVVGAYLIGSRGTPRHALFLGVTVTITHTLGVFALGFATLFASRFIVPERLFPILSLVSGLIVLGMGVVLLTQRWRRARATSGSHRQYRRLQPAAAAAMAVPFGMASRPNKTGLGRGLVFSHVHAAGVHHHHASGALTHSHGGTVHSHLPLGGSGERITWRSLLALGISGGLVPCPSALVLLLATVALNKAAYGLLLVLAFSVGLAATLTVVGLAFLYGRDRIGRPRAGARWPQWLPVASAGAVTVVGAAMCFAAVVTLPF